MNRKYILILTVIAATVGLFSGCQKEEEKVKQRKALAREFRKPMMQASAIPAKQTRLPNYYLNIGDMLEIIYHIKQEFIEDYRLNTEDTITITFPHKPSFTQTLTIPPDGKLRLQLIGTVKTYEPAPGDTRPRRGKTIHQFEEELREKYSKYFDEPELTVTFDAANKKIEELKRAITTAPRGQSRLMPIKPDGNITLPYITDIKAFGKTITELHKDVNQAYRDAGLPEVEVTVQILSVAPKKIFVMGEVRSPGLKEVDNNITLTQALAMAGGMNTRAAEDKVLVVRRKGLEIPQGVVVDVEKILESSFVSRTGVEQPDPGDLMKDFWLEDYDIVYVPTNKLAERSDWIDYVFSKGIYSVLPFSTSVGVGFSYELHDDPDFDVNE